MDLFFSWVKGHGTSIGNQQADILAGNGARQGLSNGLDLSIDQRFNLTGAKLSALGRGTTIRNLELTRLEVQAASGRPPTDAAIWKSIRDKDISRNISDFLWKSIHGAYKVGKYWANIPGAQSREQCPVCRCEDSMEHILTECSAPGQEIIWQLASDLWKHKWPVWPKPSLGLILGCAAVSFEGTSGRPASGPNRLFRIIISESAHLIWKIRCERLITRNNDRNRWHNKQEITNKWTYAINLRLTMDRKSTHQRWKKRAAKVATVLNTWSGVLHDEKSLPDDWTDSAEVLVGTSNTQARRRTRNRRTRAPD